MSGRSRGMTGSAPDPEIPTDQTPPADPISDEELARRFHVAYTSLAPLAGYELRPAYGVPWDNLPENNRQLMEATVRSVVRPLLDAERERADWAERQLEAAKVILGVNETAYAERIAELAAKDAEIERLRSALGSGWTLAQYQLRAELAVKDTEITRLRKVIERVTLHADKATEAVGPGAMIVYRQDWAELLAALTETPKEEG